MSIWISSDWHIWHMNIISYCNRPFSDIEEMNEVIINNCNSLVKKGDIHFMLGDFAFQVGRKRDEIKDLISRLEVKPIIIKGNHDSKPKLLDMGFDYVYDEAYLKIDELTVWLNHFPLKVHDDREELKRPKARIPWDLALYGHTHCPKGQEAYYEYGKLKGLNVGLDAHDYRPWHWDKIHSLYKASL